MLGPMRHPPGASRVSWAWFGAWWLTGGLWSFTLLGIATVGLFVLPVSLALTVVLARRSHGTGLLGVVSGLGLPLFYVAWLNRAGPGNVCSSTSDGGQACLQEWSPWPWLAVAVILTLGGLVLFRYRGGDHNPGNPRFWRPS